MSKLWISFKWNRKRKISFIGQQIVNKSKISSAKEYQGKVQNILFIIGGFQLFNAFRAYSNNLGIENVLFYILLGALLIVFGFFSKKNALLFTCLALVIILLYYLLLFINNPAFLFSGIIWKVATITFLVYGITKSLEERSIKKKHNFLKEK